MKLFECQNCGHPLYFENTTCSSCGLRLGYLPVRERVTALKPDKDIWRALAAPKGRYRFCANAEYEVCNWLRPASGPSALCLAFGLNRTIPNLAEPGNLAAWRELERAKKRLIYSLLRFGLPMDGSKWNKGRLAFDL